MVLWNGNAAVVGVRKEDTIWEEVQFAYNVKEKKSLRCVPIFKHHMMVECLFLRKNLCSCRILSYLTQNTFEWRFAIPSRQYSECSYLLFTRFHYQGQESCDSCDYICFHLSPPWSPLTIKILCASFFRVGGKGKRWWDFQHRANILIQTTQTVKKISDNSLPSLPHQEGVENRQALYQQRCLSLHTHRTTPLHRSPTCCHKSLLTSSPAQQHCQDGRAV